MTADEKLAVAIGFLAKIQRACRGGGEPESRLRQIDQLAGWALQRAGDGTAVEAVDLEAAEDAPPWQELTESVAGLHDGLAQIDQNLQAVMRCLLPGRPANSTGSSS